ncbi:hypothetical protein ESP57_10570 [Agromyces fucosus]|uniref:Transmembrane protein n=1 Tax=Agromyces fucosus TaxID=41985 RepID=A0A4Q2JME1_9MICO|nr:DUF6069 family protein [Agromyces fucosus]RXZ49351.1 hypothetical protein ESP57_10570 [Agromyces fucosus]
MTAQRESTHTLGTSPSLRRGAPPARATGAVLGAVFGALLIWAIAVPIAGIDLEARMGAGAQPVGPALVAIAAVVGAAGALAVSALIARFARNARRLWFVISICVGVLSLAGPLLSAASGASTAVLLVMHVVVGGSLIVGLAPRRAVEVRR